MDPDRIPSRLDDAPVRLALLGDVHANPAALEAVLADADALGISAGVVTGDLVLRGDDPEDCVARVRALGWPCVAGNTDIKVAERPPRPPEHAASLRVGSRSWTHRRLSDASLAFLAGLPLHLTVDFGPCRVAVVHGTPTDPTVALFDPDSSPQELARVAAAFDADVIVAAHTHRPMVASAAGRLLVNPGSVGESLDAADRRPSWAWIELTEAGPVARLERTEAPLAAVRVPRGMRP